MRRGMSAGNLWVVLFIIIPLVLLGLWAAGHYSGLFDIGSIGEEGYEPYDALLPGGSYDQTKWAFTTNDANCIPQAVSCNNPGQNCIGTMNPYQGVSATSNKIYLSPSGYYRGDSYHGPYLQTKNLRLINFKADFGVIATRCGSNQMYHGGGKLSTNKGPIYQVPEATGSSPNSPISIELLWDDYQLGHYQIRANGQTVQDGTIGENEQLYFIMEPDSTACYTECAGTVTFTNPRIKNLFNCDLQSGELQTDACFGGPQTINTADLPGFKRFCIDKTSTFLNAGISTESKRVYYDLAAGKSINILENQAWKFSYIADSIIIGSRTGISSNCKTTTVNDTYDLPSNDPTIKGQTLYWNSKGRFDGSNGWRYQELNLKSGNVDFMTTEPLIINEQLCPYTTTWQNYPNDQLSTNCFSVRAYNNNFRKGDIIQRNGVTIKLDDIKVRFKKDDSGKYYEYTASWRLDFPTTGTKTTLSSNNEVTIYNNLPGPGTFTTTVYATPNTINEPVIKTYTTTINSGEQKKITIQAPSDYQGTAQVKTWSTLQTPAGGISFDASNTTTGQNSTSTSWWNRFTHWITTPYRWINQVFS